MSGRDTPKDLQDSPDYSTRAGVGLTKNQDPSDEYHSKDDIYLKNLARAAYDSSTNWLNAGRRLAWNDSLRAFQGLHPSNSKYLSNDYRYRSRLFRPKTRMMIRKAEAQTAMAFFSNMDIVSIDPTDDDNPIQLASSRIMKEILQYRLTKTIPWFQTLCGGRQDADIMGVCIAKAYWKFDERYSHRESRPSIDPQTGQIRVDDMGEHVTEDYDIYNCIADHPWIDLIAPENFRFDPGADWRNPISTSPYVIEMIPMYICDAREKIKNKEWFKVSESSMRAATDLDDDTTRRSREQGRVPGKDHDSWKPKDYDIFWVRENILRHEGEDVHFFTLAGTGELLTKPKPLREVYLHGLRPYVCGSTMIEAHKTYPSAKTEITKDLQTQANDVVNLRLDNVKLTLNPRQFIRNGKGVDPTDVRNFQPGKVISVSDPELDIKWDRPPDVTQSSYEESDKINQDFDDLSGDMSNGNIQSSPQTYQSVGNIELMAGNASQVSEYEMRIFAETFVEPLVRHLIQLEQAYETNDVIIENAGRKANLFQKYGIDQITNDILQQELNCRVNVGLGATNPQQKLKNFLTAANAVKQLYGESAAICSNPEEVITEIFSLCGYKDGDRFFEPGSDIHATMQQLMQGKQKQPPAQSAQNPQLEQMKTQGDIQLQNTKIQGNLQLQNAKMQKDAVMQSHQMDIDRTRMLGQNQIDLDRARSSMELENLKHQREMDQKMAIARLEAETKIQIAHIQAQSHERASIHAANQKEGMGLNGIK